MSRVDANLAFISKVLEKVFAAQQTSHMKAHALCENHQSAHRCHHSTDTSLIKVHNDLLRALDNDWGVFWVLLDLSAAFDTLDHDILLDRLNNLGVSGAVLQWMNSYLCGRSQTVVIDDVKSDLTRSAVWYSSGVSFRTNTPRNLHNPHWCHCNDGTTSKYTYTPMIPTCMYFSRWKTWFHSKKLSVLFSLASQRSGLGWSQTICT